MVYGVVQQLYGVVTPDSVIELEIDYDSLQFFRILKDNLEHDMTSHSTHPSKSSRTTSYSLYSKDP